MIDDGDCGAIGGMKIGRGNRSTYASVFVLNSSFCLKKTLLSGVPEYKQFSS
jgi:hypothetical protein